jgi:uncharacterized secreted protein with C-terminal beta-propeller domain/predicted small secreted protein
MRKAIILLLAFALLLTACSDDDGTADGTGSGIQAVAATFDPSRISFRASLELFDSCDAVLAHFQSEALARVGPYGLQGGGGVFPMPFFDVAEEALAFEGDMAAPATTMAGASIGRDDGGFVEGTDFSGTNVQVAGVDEPDVIKTDGERILFVMNGMLHYVDVTGGTSQRLGSLALPGWDHRFFFDGDTAIVIARGDGYTIAYDEAAARIAPPYLGPTTLVFQVDISDPTDMTVLRTLRVDGSDLSARAVDGRIRLVISAYPSELPFVYPSNQYAEDFAQQANEQVIRESTIDQWLPNFTLVAGTDGEIVDEGRIVDCAQVHKPAEFAGFDTLSVITMDLDEGLSDVTGAAVIAQGQTIYASLESLYVATNVWVPDQWIGTPEARDLEQEYETAIHRFDITGRNADYVASGSIQGHLLNQFSMDEHDGFLRVATTDGAPWGFSEDAESYVTVLQTRDDRLEQVGRVGEMGKGERIFSVRFIEDAAYVVTFRQVDPFYVVDLSDPESPEVAGELKINGYSGYLHPLGDDKILGIGQDATSEGRTTGAKATVFDVSDPASPRELGTWTATDSYTEVEWNHLAFLYWAPEDIAVMPLQSWQDQFFGAVVLKTDDGVREFGRVSHSIDKEAFESDCRVLTDEELRALDDTYMGEPGMIVQVCGEDEIGATNMECEWLFYDDAVALAAEEGVDLTTLMSEGDRLEVCWPRWDQQDPAISRSLVIGDTLWTLSYRALQANALTDLGILDQIVFG